MDILRKIKAQSAPDNVLKYGVAFLILVILFIALLYVVINQPASIFPDHCSVSPVFSCVDAMSNQSAIVATLTNNLGSGVTIIAQDQNIQIKGTTPCDNPQIYFEDANKQVHLISKGNVTIEWAANEERTLLITGCTFRQNQRPRVSVMLSYVEQRSPYLKQTTATIAVKTNIR